MFVGISQDALPGHPVFLGDQIIKGFINSVIMPLCPWTVLRTALNFIQHADFLFCRQGDHLHGKSLILKKSECIFRNSPGNSPRRQIENCLWQSISHRLNSRINGGNRLAGTCRCFYKKPPMSQNRLINAWDELFLTLSVLKRETAGTNRKISFFNPGYLMTHPDRKSVYQFSIPYFQLISCHFFPESLNFSRLQMHIRHLDLYFF